MKLIIANWLVGIALMVLGFSNGGFGLLACWLGIGFFLTGLGYGCIGAKIYGKKESGYYPLWSIIIYLPFFLYTLTIWHVVQLLMRENACDRVTDTIIIGRRLCGKEYPAGVDNYVDLTAEFWEPESVIEHYNYISLPVLDGDIPEIKALNKVMDSLSNGVTYIHCAQGHGRTGLFAALLLARHGKATTLEEALSLLKSKRPALSLNAKQKAFVRTIMAQKSPT